MSCDGQMPSDPGLELDAVTARLGGGNAVHIVTGKGSVWYGEPRNQWMDVEFNARQTADGSVHGKWHYQFHSRKPGGRIMAEVVCLSVVGNSAWLGGRAIQAVNPGNVGKWFGLRVVDNGEGANDPPDQMTRSQWFGVNEFMAWDMCEQMPTDHELQDIPKGNIQIR
jgi:hypothetical protein